MQTAYCIGCGYPIIKGKCDCSSGVPNPEQVAHRADELPTNADFALLLHAGAESALRERLGFA